MSIAESVIGIADKVLGKFIPDKTLRDQLRHEMNMAFHEANLAQIELNKIEATGNWFQSSWRPSVGWICSISMGYHFILQPLLVFILRAAGNDVELPDFDFSQLSTILMALLGMSGLRTYEKTKNVAKQ